MKPSRQRRTDRTSVNGSAARTVRQWIAVHWASADGGTRVVKAVACASDGAPFDGPVGATVDGGCDGDDRAAPVGAAMAGDETGGRDGVTPQPASAMTLSTAASRRRVLIGAPDRLRDGGG
jgi:hypothetical protein